VAIGRVARAPGLPNLQKIELAEGYCPPAFLNRVQQALAARHRTASLPQGSNLTHSRGRPPGGAER
jgi:hypothetical protein